LFNKALQIYIESQDPTTFKKSAHIFFFQVLYAAKKFNLLNDEFLPIYERLEDHQDKIIKMKHMQEDKNGHYQSGVCRDIYK